MAVIVLKHAEKYAGTHAERLAMDVSSVNKGATFFEWDTSDLFTLSPTGWVEKIGQVKGEMSLSGSNVTIGAATFAMSGGDTLRGKAADKPTAAAAHAVIPYCFYFSIDTGVVEATDGTNWVVI